MATWTPIDLNVDMTFGVVFLAVALSSTIYGATCIQIFSYCHSTRSKQDTQILRYGVLALWLVDTFQQVLILHAGYYYLIAHFGDRSAPSTSLPCLGLSDFSRSVPTEALLLAISALLFNVFLTIRLWLLSQNVALSALAAVLTISTAGKLNSWASLKDTPTFITWISISLGTSIAFAIRGYGYDSLTFGLLDIRPHGIAALCLSIVTECMLSATVAHHLYKARSGLRKYDDFLTKVIMLTVTTGMLTTPFNVAELVTYVVSTKSLTVLLFNFLLAKLYALAFVTMLNIRSYLHNLALKASEPDSWAMSNPNLIFSAVPPSVLLSTSTSDGPQPVAEPIEIEATPGPWLTSMDAAHVR